MSRGKMAVAASINKRDSKSRPAMTVISIEIGTPLALSAGFRRVWPCIERPE